MFANLGCWQLWQRKIESQLYIFINTSARAGYDTRSIFKRSLKRFEFRVFLFLDCCLTKAEEPSLSYYLPIAGGRIIGFIPFPKVLVLCEMQSVSSRIWTRVAVSISYDDNHYTTGTSKSNISLEEWLKSSHHIVGLDSLFNGASTIVNFLMPKPSL